MMEISLYLPVRQLLDWNLLNKHFYDKIVPQVMRNRQLNPVIQKKLHLYIKDKKVYGMMINPTSQPREIDFEEDEWRHDSQYVTEDRPFLLFTFDQLGLANDEEILPHYILQLTGYNFIIFPLKEAIFVTRGLVV